MVTLNPDQIAAIREAQGNACGCCGEPFGKQVPVIDHRPGGAVVRSLVCPGCAEDIANLPRVHAYLSRYGSTNG